ncbi:MAG: polysaccharide deacetylase family protein [Bacteroidota bacterium]
MLLVYIPKISPRACYIIKLMCQNIIGINTQFTYSPEEFSSYDGPKINYSTRLIQDEIFIYSTGLLFESTIKSFDVVVSQTEGYPMLFPVHDKQASLPFDVFSAAFFLVSRYEEYLPSIKDKFGRFDAKESLAFKNGFLQKPLVNIWAEKLKAILSQRYPALQFPARHYKHVPSIDIDLAWVFKHKGFIRSLGGFYKSLAKRNFKEFAQRLRVILNKEADPFDSYDYLLESQKKFGFEPIYFILLADYALMDKNTPNNNQQFHSLIKRLGDYATVGIHPSYASNFFPDKLGIETERLSLILSKEIIHSRQHFLMLDLPLTYRNLINFGIRNDYTKGYASEIGFRASICTAFNFYDLELNKETQLIVHPFAVMDGTLRDYYNVDATSALSFIIPLIEECKSVNGTFISLWHNESLSESGRWNGWRNVFEKMFNI